MKRTALVILALILFALPAHATVASSTSRATLACNGSVQAFPFTFGIGATSEIQVILTTSAGVETVLTETTNYTVDCTNNDCTAGGTVNTVSTYASGNTITLLRNVPLTQASDFTEGMPTLYETFEQGLDKSIRIDQQLQEELNRVPMLPRSTTTSNPTLANPVAGQYLRWNLTADGIDSTASSNDLGTFTQSGTGAVARTADAKMGEIVSVKDFGAVGDGVTDDSAAFTASIAALTTGSVWFIPAGTYAIDNVVYNKSNTTIVGSGTLKPTSTSSSDYTLMIGHATSGQQAYNITGTVRLKTGSTGLTYTTADGLWLQNLSGSNITVDAAEGFRTGVKLVGDGWGTAYNNIYLGSIANNNRGVELYATNSGWVNEIKFYGGRFDWWATAYNIAPSSSYTHIYIPHNAVNAHNGIIFYSPSLEGYHQFVYCDGRLIKIIDARSESSSIMLGKVSFGANSFLNYYSNAAASNYLNYASAAMWNDVTLSTITHSDTANVFTVTGAGNLTSYCYPGAVIMVKVGSDYLQTIVLYSSYVAGTDTMTIVHARSGVWTSATTFAKLYVSIFANAGTQNTIHQNYGTSGFGTYKHTADAKHTQFQSGHLILEAGQATGSGSEYPALVLHNSASAAQTVMETINASGVKTFGMTGAGQITAGNLYPVADNTYYLGKNDDDTPAAWKGLIMKDQTNGKYYRVDLQGGTLTVTDLTD